jgi:DNA-binding transcriptional MerR regulator
MKSYCKYDIQGFADSLGLPIEDIEDLYNELITELNSETLKLKKAAAEQDLNTIKNTIHNIKGVTGNYRIFDVYNETITISNSLKLDGSSNIDQLLNNLYTISENAIGEIRKFFLLWHIHLP